MEMSTREATVVEIRMLKGFATFMMLAAVAITIASVFESKAGEMSPLTLGMLFLGIVGFQIQKILKRMDERLTTLEKSAAVSPVD